MLKHYHAAILIPILATVLGCQTMANKASYVEKISEKTGRLRTKCLRL